jgi:hypothetical protein
MVHVRSMRVAVFSGLVCRRAQGRNKRLAATRCHGPSRSRGTGSLRQQARRDREDDRLTTVCLVDGLSQVCTRTIRSVRVQLLTIHHRTRLACRRRPREWSAHDTRRTHHRTSYHSHHTRARMSSTHQCRDRRRWCALVCAVELQRRRMVARVPHGWISLHLEAMRPRDGTIVTDVSRTTSTLQCSSTFLRYTIPAHPACTYDGDAFDSASLMCTSRHTVIADDRCACSVVGPRNGRAGRPATGVDRALQSLVRVHECNDQTARAHAHSRLLLLCVRMCVCVCVCEHDPLWRRVHTLNAHWQVHRHFPLVDHTSSHRADCVKNRCAAMSSSAHDGSTEIVYPCPLARVFGCALKEACSVLDDYESGTRGTMMRIVLDSRMDLVGSFTTTATMGDEAVAEQVQAFRERYSKAVEDRMLRTVGGRGAPPPKSTKLKLVNGDQVWRLTIPGSSLANFDYVKMFREWRDELDASNTTDRCSTTQSETTQ